MQPSKDAIRHSTSLGFMRHLNNANIDAKAMMVLGNYCKLSITEYL